MPLQVILTLNYALLTLLSASPTYCLEILFSALIEKISRCTDLACKSCLINSANFYLLNNTESNKVTQCDRLTYCCNF